MSTKKIQEPGSFITGVCLIVAGAYNTVIRKKGFLGFLCLVSSGFFLNSSFKEEEKEEEEEEQ